MKRHDNACPITKYWLHTNNRYEPGMSLKKKKKKKANHYEREGIGWGDTGVSECSSPSFWPTGGLGRCWIAKSVHSCHFSLAWICAPAIERKTPMRACVRREWESKRGVQSGEGGLIMLMKCMHVGWCKQSVPTWAAGSCETELSNVLPVRGVPRHTSPTRFKAEGAMVNRANNLFMALPASLGPGTNTLRHSSPLLCLSWHLCSMSGAEGVQVLLCALWTGMWWRANLSELTERSS